MLFCCAFAFISYDCFKGVTIAKFLFINPHTRNQHRHEQTTSGAERDLS